MVLFDIKYLSVVVYEKKFKLVQAVKLPGVLFAANGFNYNNSEKLFG